MFDHLETHFEQPIVVASPVGRRWLKRSFDVSVALGLLLPMLLTALVLWVLNPFLNPGPVFFRQDRMGKRCRKFVAWKFRTMRVVPNKCRGAFDPLEAGRVSRFAGWMRKIRLDELPQIMNVLRGEMSMIGPRPDAYTHACVYLRQIPGYVDRHAVRPGISGLAQTEVGYVETRADVQRKVAADLQYISNWSFRMDLWIVWRTVQVICGRQGR